MMLAKQSGFSRPREVIVDVKSVLLTKIHELNGTSPPVDCVYAIELLGPSSRVLFLGGLSHSFAGMLSPN